jgi:PKD repeat protein
MSILSLLRRWLLRSRSKRLRRSPLAHFRPRMQELEPRRLLANTLGTSVHLDFGSATSPVAVGYNAGLLKAYTPTQGYGWASLTGLSTVDRGTSNPLTRDFVLGRDGTYLIDLPNGTYNVKVTLGDPSARRDQIALYAQGNQLASGLTTAANQFISPSYTVQVANGQLAVRVVDNGGANPYFALDAIDVTPTALPTSYSVWSSATTPGTVTDPDANAVELGVKFRADVSGTITGIRFYKGPQNTGTHVANLWTSTGQLLATATFTNETATGWQQVNFASPVAIAANTTYIASYHTAVGHYSSDTNYFATSGVHTGPLQALANGTDGPNSVYLYGAGGFPTQTYNSANYWVDVTFSTAPDTTPPTVSTVTPAVGATGVGVTAPVIVTFSEAIDPTTINTGSIELHDPNNAVVAASVTYNASTKTATLTPTAALANSATYTILVKGGAADPRVKDLAGNALAANFTASFTTAAPVPPPVANAGPDGSANEGSSFKFTGSVSGGTAPLKYAWTFGDGSTASGSLTPSHTYADNGTYTATLTVTDAQGRSSQDSAVVTVANVAPTVTLSGPYTGTANTPVAFSAAVTDPSSADTAAGFTYAWNFGDAGTSTQPSPSHAYAAAGTFTVSLTVKDKDGGTTTAGTTITVSVPPLPGGFIQTPYDKIPNFGANPTIVSARSGAWSDPTTWSLGRLPTAGDVVDITAGNTVTYDVVSDAALNTVAVNPGGHLIFRTDVSTRLTATNILILEGGELQVGTPANPVAPTVKAELIIADSPINTTTDPEQFGHGLIGLGKVTLSGAVKSQTFVRLAVEPRAGATTLTLAQPVSGWQAGDKLVLPDTRQLDWNQRDANYVPQWETPTLAAVSADGLTLTLTAPLQFDHLGARDGNGVLTFLPHVADLSRNISVRSQSPTGTRGQVMFTYHADVDVRYVSFGGLGRTTINDIDDTTFDSAGHVTHVGTNEEDRNAVQFRHLVGPSTPQADGYQYTFLGNTVTCPLNPMPFVWGINVNDSSYGLIQDNVLFNWAGAGIVTKTGSESYNLFEHNFVVRVNGTGTRIDDAGTAGVGFWFRGPNNYVRDNVASDITGGVYSYGYNVYARYLGWVDVPAFQGADPSIAGQSVSVDMNATPLLDFTNNEVYGATPNGMTVWWIGAFFTTPKGNAGVIKDLHVWNQYQWGYFGYETNNLTIDGFVERGNPAITEGISKGMWFADYQQKGLVIQNADIQGESCGIQTPGLADGVTVIQNSYLRNGVNITVSTSNSVNGSAGLPAKSTVIRNVRFAAPQGSPLVAIEMDFTTVGEGTGGQCNLISPDTVYVYDYNGVAGDNFQVYYAEQAATYVVPQTTSSLTGAPVGGLTNQQTWVRYGIAIAGAVAPADATTRTGIVGLVHPI